MHPYQIETSKYLVFNLLHEKLKLSWSKRLRARYFDVPI